MPKTNGEPRAAASRGGVLTAALGGRVGGRKPESALDERLADECPVLHAFLTQAVTDSGEDRRTSVLTIFTEEGKWKGVLHERQESLNLFMTADSFMGVCQGLEGRLAAGDAEWRKDRGARR